MRVDFTRKAGHRQREHIHCWPRRRATNSVLVATRQFREFLLSLLPVSL
ncbi:hypothetical protein KCP70_00215 [Salmonella enterica subsp. enterica]|nr:hypothetical protein KCP70_00215 [Salmonella enterica subsp. enterica]